MLDRVRLFDFAGVIFEAQGKEFSFLDQHEVDRGVVRRGDDLPDRLSFEGRVEVPNLHLVEVRLRQLLVPDFNAHVGFEGYLERAPKVVLLSGLVEVADRTLHLHNKLHCFPEGQLP